MAHMLSDLRGMRMDDLIKNHDFHARQTQTDTNYYLAEIARRDQDRQCYVTRAGITWLTIIVTLATIINVVIAFKPCH